MNPLIEQAKELIKNTNAEFTRLCGEISHSISPDDFSEANAIYYATANLNVIASTLINEPQVIEGKIIVDNRQSKVTISNIDLRGKTAFEIFHNGNWLRGYRENSQYGQIFRNNENSFIISSGSDTGRVSLPLETFL
ncbi:hypothetical protein FACS1894188_11000 [Clostridia bacterium]|nr:hypothetical protein FACS1894188_11000 [Clostridia bacterium]